MAPRPGTRLKNLPRLVLIMADNNSQPAEIIIPPLPAKLSTGIPTPDSKMCNAKGGGLVAHFRVFQVVQTASGDAGGGFLVHIFVCSRSYKLCGMYVVGCEVWDLGCRVWGRGV